MREERREAMGEGVVVGEGMGRGHLVWSALGHRIMSTTTCPPVSSYPYASVPRSEGGSVLVAALALRSRANDARSDCSQRGKGMETLGGSGRARNSSAIGGGHEGVARVAS